MSRQLMVDNSESLIDIRLVPVWTTSHAHHCMRSPVDRLMLAAAKQTCHVVPLECT